MLKTMQIRKNKPPEFHEEIMHDLWEPETPSLTVHQAQELPTKTEQLRFS